MEQKRAIRPTDRMEEDVADDVTWFRLKLTTILLSSDWFSSAEFNVDSASSSILIMSFDPMMASRLNIIS